MTTFRRTCTSLAVEQNWLSQNDREMILKDMYNTSALKRINISDRHELFKDLKSKKGTNKSGGVYGEQNEKVKMARTSKSFNTTNTFVKTASYSWTIPGG